MLLSLGTPLILGGDELRRTQRGNNNPWCQDNEISWIDWRLVQLHADLLRFVRLAIAFRMRHPAFLRPEFFSGTNGKAIPDIAWLDPDGTPHEWTPDSRTLAALIDGGRAETAADPDDSDLLLVLNADPADVVVALPTPSRRRESWYRAIDTGLAPPADIAEPGAEERLAGAKYPVRGRSLVALLAR
jgi:glycogen operon protein